MYMKKRRVATRSYQEFWEGEKCGDRPTDDRQGKIIGQTDGQIDTCTRKSRTRKSLFIALHPWWNMQE